MIRCVLVHKTGVIVALGIVEENIRRMKAGDPLSCDLGRMLSQTAADELYDEVDGARGTVALMMSYGETHEQIVREWNAQLAASPGPTLEMPANALADAIELDAQLRAEGLI